MKRGFFAPWRRLGLWQPSQRCTRGASRSVRKRSAKVYAAPYKEREIVAAPARAAPHKARVAAAL
ncbi:protein of unknown function [Cupriavidus taiwanensis]|uniref:Uncharacterized protein n=1 Tax=Cupriavidus taiwanensis TaxID=164546 RepID=A0A7Z7J5H5_9BURK|nr:protein of unknown function [Cupriavidus taiwanensis]SOZ01213.1 hypothetical protein CBM2595_A30112 [Cupriavidus taiwanensis]SOZ04144.1 hypothetical protein CBM2597_A50266 [Cupriavidus taiwanensis]SPC08794.1 hypothetical protein CBM2594_A40117 [Cupriavidus taiwanensis]SPD38538.1 protein of unknown function [Cupriavidus taiwanensis]